MKNKKMTLLVIVVLIIAAAIIAGLVMQGPDKHVQAQPDSGNTGESTAASTAEEDPTPTAEEDSTATTEEDPAATAEENPTPTAGEISATTVEKQPLTITTRYFTCVFPAECDGYVSHTTGEDNGVITESFRLLLGDSKYDVFSISFGDAENGELAGYFETDSGLVPVTFTVAAYTEAELNAIGEKDVYVRLMEQFNPILEGIKGDERFKADVSDASAVNEAALRYWSVSLLKGMEWEETEVGSEYRADFYGEIAGARIMLYTIYIGGEASETRSAVGRFKVDGDWRDIYIESYPPANAENWTDADLAAFGGMMETVNASLQAIMASPDYSDGR